MMLKRMLYRAAREAAHRVRGALYRGSGRSCPVCGKSSRRFIGWGNPVRPEARCPQCGSLERHRLVWLFLHRHTDLFDGRPKRLLHLAPERGMERRLQRIPGVEYLSADLMHPAAMVKMDITDIGYPDGYFDVIYCSHILEHIPDDRRAMRELHRVLAPSGWALVQVPVTVESTFEDPTATTPEARLRLFGQADHVRRYGNDFADRLRASGFEVRTAPPAQVTTPDERRSMVLLEEDTIFLCTR
jgi:hypothetical protein